MSGARLQPCVSVGCAWGQRPEHGLCNGIPLLCRQPIPAQGPPSRPVRRHHRGRGTA